MTFFFSLPLVAHLHRKVIGLNVYVCFCCHVYGMFGIELWYMLFSVRLSAVDTVVCAIIDDHRDVEKKYDGNGD